VALADPCFPATGSVLHPDSEHAEDDGGEEGEGDDGSKHVEPRPQFHRSLLCRTNPALAQVASRQNRNLSRLCRAGQQISMLQRNNSMKKFGVSLPPHRLVHNNNVSAGLIQEDILKVTTVFTIN
jgi:hypothetical protein